MRAKVALLGVLVVASASRVKAEDDWALTRPRRPAPSRVGAPQPGRAGSESVPALLARVEQRDAPLSSRAEALRGLGMRRARSAARPLAALLPRVERPLRPLLVWALWSCAGRAAEASIAREVVSRRDEGTRTMAALVLGEADAPASARALTSLGRAPQASVRLAAAWGLSRRGMLESREVLVRTLDLPAPLGPVALAVAPCDVDLLARGLFVRDIAVQRAAAARLLLPCRSELPVLPVPSWPFSAAAYLAQVGEQEAGQTVAPDPGEGHAIVAAARARLAEGGDATVAVLAVLAPARGGLVPSALLERAPCLSAALPRGLAGALREPLAMLAAGSERGPALSALRLLAASGGMERPEITAVLAGRDVAAQRAVLDGLGAAEGLSATVRARVERLLDVRDWPTRMRAAYALRGHVAPAWLGSEPVALVREAARREEGARAIVCSHSEPPAN